MFIATPTFRTHATPKMTGTGGLQRVPRSIVEAYRIPIPPIATQQAIIDGVESEQRLINANKQLIERFEAKIKSAINRIWDNAE